MGIAMLVALVAAILGSGYCLLKNWSMRKLINPSYRERYSDLDHTATSIFNKTNDFSKHASYLHPNGTACKDLIAPEDDSDEVNMEILTAVMDAGDNYLSLFQDRKRSRAIERDIRKQQAIKTMNDIEKLINSIGQRAVANDMQIINEDTEESTRIK